MPEQEFNKTEKATPYKLKKAKEKGQVAKSFEFTSFIALLAFVAVTSACWHTAIKKYLHLSANLLQLSGVINFQVSNLSHLLLYISFVVSLLLAPMLFALAGGSILASVVQTGFIWSTEPLKFDFTRINPVQGFKKIVNIRLLFDLIKNLLKIAIYTTIIYFFIKDILHKIISLMYLNPISYPNTLVGYVESLLIRLLIAVGFVAALDLLFTRWQFSKQQRMSVREVREEIKHREGDPLIRGKIRQLQKELRKRSSAVAKVKDADVLVTNPTHIAVALKYEQATMIAPQMIAKGAGKTALYMKRIAQYHQVPIIYNKELARSLFKQINLNSYISEDFYQEVAVILKKIYQEKENRL